MVNWPINEPNPDLISQRPVMGGRLICLNPGGGVSPGNVWIGPGSGVPTSGTSGDGATWAGPGSLYIDATNGAVYINSNTAASPTWSLLDSVAGPGEAAVSQATPADPTAPASTSAFAMQGLAGAITPKTTGRLLLTISGNLIGISTTAGDGIKYQLSYGTGTAPANAAALAGTQVGATQEYTNDTTVTAADIHQPFSIQAVITGLTVGTAYWLDLAAEAVATISKVGLSNVSVSAIEV